ncbi:hypothetical protein ACFWZ7_26190 [Nocardiopsis alba]
MKEQSPVPVADRCREPRRHRTPDTERCALCADQMPLPGFEEIA